MKQILGLIYKAFTLLVASPINFYKSYFPLFKSTKGAYFIATECQRFGLHQFWYYTFYKMRNLYGFKKARNAYLFFEGLGQWNKENFYVDYLTYILYGWLRAKWNVILVNLLMIAAMLWAFHPPKQSVWIIPYVFIFLIISSSYYTDIFTNQIKPEIWAWPFFFLAFIAAVNGKWPLYFAFGVIAILGNFTVALILVLVSFFFILFTKVTFWAAGVYLFYIFYTTWRMIPSIQAGSHKRLFSHINRDETKASLSFNAWQWFFLLDYFLPSVIWAVSTGNRHPVLLIVISSGLVYFVFYRIIMFGDYHTIFRMLLISNLLLLTAQWNTPTAIAILAFLVIGYLRIDPQLKYALKHLVLIDAKPIITKLTDFLLPIPAGVRILKEKHSPERCVFFDKKISWHFLAALRFACIEKNISIVPNIVMYDVPLYNQKIIKPVLSCFNQNMDKNKLQATMQNMGANYIMCFSKDFQEQLVKEGFEIVSILTDLKGVFPGSDEIPALFIYKSPWNYNLIENVSQVELGYNQLSFKGSPGEYKVKLRWYPQFHLIENGEKVQISGVDQDLGFFNILKKEEGPAELIFI